MNDFFQEEKKKIESVLHHEKKEKIQINFYKNKKTGKIITHKEYNHMKFEQGVMFNSAQQSSLTEVNNSALLIENSIMESINDYVPYIPEETIES